MGKKQQQLLLCNSYIQYNNTYKLFPQEIFCLLYKNVILKTAPCKIIRLVEKTVQKKKTNQ